MIAIALPSPKRHWSTLSFASTLYLYPILDLLLTNIPEELQPEIRLGLQEALVNAAKHGNNLDANKTIVVQFSATKEGYIWIISDEGSGFCAAEDIPQNADCPDLPSEEAENGRGLCILHQIFDQVRWNYQGTQLTLAKRIRKDKRRLLSASMN